MGGREGIDPRSPATVVISQRIRPGLEGEFLPWQEEMNAKCREFPGFEACEIIPPMPGVQDDFVIVFRFDSFAHLDGWLRSDVRRQYLAEGERFFATEASQQVVPSGQPPRSVGMVISTRVRPGKEAEYLAWQREIDAAAARFPGHQGSEVFPPIPGRQEEWVTVVRFDSPGHLDTWIDSDVRRKLIAKGEPLFAHVQLAKVGAGFPGWFTPGKDGGDAAGMPPSWKQALAVLLVLYPLVMLLSRYLFPFLEGLPSPVAMFAGNAVSVAMLTWGMMPLVNRLLGFWLVPDAGARALKEALGLGVVLLGFVVSVVAFLVLQ